MRIRSNDTLAGIPILQVRDVLRAVPLAWNAGHFERSLSISKTKASELIQLLLQRGYAEPSETFPGELETTTAGNAFAAASAARPVTRGTAERALRGLIERAREVNVDSRFILRVVKIEVFGSYLDPSIERLGDVDVIIEFRPKRPEKWGTDVREYSPVYQHGGSIFEMVVAPELDVRRHLRGRSRVLSLHDVRERSLVPESQRPAVFED